MHTDEQVDETAFRKVSDFALEALPEPDNRALADQPLSDLGNSRRLVARYGHDLRAIGDTRPSWRRWDGRRWTEDGAKAAALDYCHKTADAIALEAQALDEDAGAAPRRRGSSKADFAKRIAVHRKWATLSGNRNRWQGMLEASVPSLQVRMEQLDAHPFHLNLINGTLNLKEVAAEPRTFRVHDHSRSDLITRLAGAGYDPNAEAPRFLAFLDRIMPDRERQNFLQRFFGYCLTGSTSEQSLLIAYGTGANGKSTLFDVISRVMGDYATTIDIKSLLHSEYKRGADASPDLARLPGTRLAIANEPEANDRLSESLIKAITGGDKIVVRGLYRDPFEFSPTFKIVVLSNVLPRIQGTDFGIWRRLVLLSFDQVITKGEQRSKADFTEELMKEATGILRWLLDGFLLYQERGLDIPASVRAETERYRADNNPVGLFLETAIVPEDGARVAATRLFTAYEKWCQANAITASSQRWFGSRMTELGYKRVTSGIAFYVGIQLLCEQFGDPSGQEREP
jgi:putative DNA primase/helicase